MKIAVGVPIILRIRFTIMKITLILEPIILLFLCRELVGPMIKREKSVFLQFFFES